MPRKKTVKKSARKKPAAKRKVAKAKKKRASKKIQRQAPELEKENQQIAPTEPEQQYIDINEYEPGLDIKKKLLLIITIILAVVVVGIWLWSLRVRTSSSGTDLGLLTQETQSTIDELTQAFQEVRDGLGKAKDQITQEQELLEIKDDVLSTLEKNLNTNNWPIHVSEVLQLSVGYPVDWNKNETASLLTIASNPDAPEVAKVTIDVFENENELSLIAWAEKWHTLSDTTINWTRKDIGLTIDGQETVTYLADNELSGLEADTIYYMAMTSRANKIYIINVLLPRDLYSSTTDKILSTIKFGT